MKAPWIYRWYLLLSLAIWFASMLLMVFLEVVMRVGMWTAMAVNWAGTVAAIVLVAIVTPRYRRWEAQQR